MKIFLKSFNFFSVFNPVSLGTVFPHGSFAKSTVRYRNKML